MRALGFDVKRAEVQAILREYDRDGTGLIAERDFVTVGSFPPPPSR
jgi:Ca2+-binding EF-hand superfamily protein